MNNHTKDSLQIISPYVRDLQNPENKNWRILHQQFSEYGRNAKEWMRKCVLLLPEIEKHKIWKRKGFENIYEYARQIAGMSRDVVNDSLRILNKTENMPALREIINKKGLNAVRPIMAIVTEQTEKFWADKAKIMTNNALRAYVKEFKNNRLGQWDIPSAQSVNLQTEIANIKDFNSEAQVSKKVFITMEVDPEIADQLNKLKGSGDWNSLMKELLSLRKEKLESQKPQAIKAKSRHIPVEIKRFVLKKTNSTCVFPKCNKPSEILHHTDRFAMYGLHDPEKIVTLCKAHEQLAHLGLIENENSEPSFWKVRKQANENDPKYEIDQIVEKFRLPG